MKTSLLVVALCFSHLLLLGQNSPISKVYIQDNFLIIKRNSDNVTTQKVPLNFQNITGDESNVTIKNGNVLYTFLLGGFLNISGGVYGTTIATATTAFSNLVSTGSSISNSVLVPVSSATNTDTAIPLTFKSGMIEWTNVGTGIVTITTQDGKNTILTNSFSARAFPISTGITYNGYTLSLSGGATIQWTFNQ